MNKLLAIIKHGLPWAILVYCSLQLTLYLTNKAVTSISSSYFKDFIIYTVCGLVFGALYNHRLERLTDDNK